jgi:branched-chain amino acid transport system permease protein
VPTTRRRLARAATILLASAGVALSLAFTAVPAAAADAPIDPATAQQSILVVARDNSAPPAKPLPGIPVEVKGDGYDVTATTGADGRVEVGVPTPGSYRVLLDVSKVPAGLALPSALKPDRTIEVDAGNKQVLANYLFTSAAAQQQSTATPSPGATATHQKASGSSASADFGRRIWPALATGLIFGLLLALASIGVSLIYGTTGLNNFAHGELVTFGGLMAYTFTSIAGLPGWLAIVIATALGGAFGFVQDLGIWRPLRRKRVALIPLMIVSIGFSLAGLGGSLLAYYQTIQWDSGAQILLAIFAAVTLGGLGSAYGALAGSLVIGLFINVSAIWLPANLKLVAALVAMIVILLVRPQGILGRKDRIG